MKYAEIKEKTAVELAALSRDLRQELFMLRLQKASSQLEKTSRLRNLRHDIARVETRLTELRRAKAIRQETNA
jgi:large subunit ribosomal protein L29